MDTRHLLRLLPSIDDLLQAAIADDTLSTLPHGLLVDLARRVVERARESIRAGHAAPAMHELVAEMRSEAMPLLHSTLRGVVNATGVILHTNLGRAPLAVAALAAMARVDGGYSSLEYDLAEGERGDRMAHTRDLLRRLTGAEDALVVNNNAAALLLITTALAAGKEIIVSRGEAVEIGGSFRIPDVVRQSGARLVEVGTTNRTYLRDYEEAIGPDTAMVLRVHPSNFHLSGFVHQADMAELARLTQSRNVLLVDDLGSGCLLDTALYGLAHEPTVQERVKLGADLVCWSGDKLMGGPQSGLIGGRAPLVRALHRHPLMRALRPGKSVLAALDATLRLYLLGQATTDIPIWQMIATPLATLTNRAAHWATSAAPPLDAWLEPGESTIGGGSLPGETLPTTLLALRHASLSAAALSARLRVHHPPIIARIERDLLLLDPRTVLPDQDAVVASMLGQGIRDENAKDAKDAKGR